MLPSSATTWASAATTASPTSRTSSASRSQADTTRVVLCFASALALAQLPGALPLPSSRSRFGRVLTARSATPRAACASSATAVEGYKLFVFDALGGAGRHRRRALRAAGRHHQPQRDRARQLDRGRDLGRGRRPRHADRRGRSAPSSSTAPRAGSPARFPRSGCTCSARCSSLVTLFLPKGVVGLCGRSSRAAVARAHGERRGMKAPRMTHARSTSAHALSRRRHRQLRRLQGAERPVAAASSRASCAASSAPTAPARRR